MGHKLNHLNEPLPPKQHMSPKDLFLLQIKPLIQNDLRDVIEKTFSSVKTQRYETILYFKLLIIMIVYTTSYRELIGLANAIIQHFLGVEKIPSKSAIHWFTKQNLEKANKLLIHIKLNDKLEENQLPTHNLIAKEKFGENVVCVVGLSFLVFTFLSILGLFA